MQMKSNKNSSRRVFQKYEIRTLLKDWYATFWLYYSRDCDIWPSRFSPFKLMDGGWRPAERQTTTVFIATSVSVSHTSFTAFPSSSSSSSPFLFFSFFHFQSDPFRILQDIYQDSRTSNRRLLHPIFSADVMPVNSFELQLFLMP